MAKRKAAKAKAAKGRTKRVAAKRAVKPASKTKVEPIAPGFHVITPAFRVKPCAKAIAFCERVFGAKVKDRYDGPGGAVMHAELRIGDSIVMCGDPMPGMAEPISLGAMVYVKDCDAVFQRALDAGATVLRPIQDQFYGDRSGTVRDPHGNEWTIATHIEDVSQKEMHRRMEAMMQGGGGASDESSEEE